MRRTQSSILRRGAALLFVLGALVLATTAAAALVHAASAARLQGRTATQGVLADELLRSAEAPILAWLTASSEMTALAPDADRPRVDLLNDTWETADLAFTLRITAWDQCGMVPLAVARSGSPLRGALPHEMLGVIDRTTAEARRDAGLDLLDALRREADPPTFPAPPMAPPIPFGSTTATGADDHAAPPDAPPLAIGELVSTHGARRINVNTAPMDLVEAALRAAGRDGLDQIIDARAQGSAVPASNLPGAEDAVQPGSPPSGQVHAGPERATSSRAVPKRAGPEIVVASDAWSFRIDVRVGRVQRSWWAVYRKSAKKWECVQRLGIPG